MPQPARDNAERRLTGLRRNSVAISVMLLVQYGLGTAINLYVRVPVTGGSLAAGYWGRVRVR